MKSYTNSGFNNLSNDEKRKILYSRADKQNRGDILSEQEESELIECLTVKQVKICDSEKINEDCLEKYQKGVNKCKYFFDRPNPAFLETPPVIFYPVAEITREHKEPVFIDHFSS